MAIGSTPPWLDVKPSDFVHAANEGASAGLGAARLRQAGESEAGRLALEAQSINERAAAQEAQLSEHERIAQMEAQTRKEIAQQNQLRETQQLAIQQAYHQAQIGLGKQRIDEQKAIANAKAKEAAMTYQQEQGAAQYLKENPGDVAGALLNFPRARSVVGVISRSQGKEPMSGINEMTDSKGNRFYQSGPGSVRRIPQPMDTQTYDTTVPEVPAKPEVSHREGQSKLLGIPIPFTGKTVVDSPAVPAVPEKTIKHRRQVPADAQNTAVSPPGKSSPSAPPTAKTKLQRGREIQAEHPDWTKEEVIKAVNDEF